MSEITRRMWRDGVTQVRWCKKNKVSVRYLRAIISGRRGFYRAGEAERIIGLLEKDGYWIEKEAA